MDNERDVLQSHASFVFNQENSLHIFFRKMVKLFFFFLEFLLHLHKCTYATYRVHAVLFEYVCF